MITSAQLALLPRRTVKLVPAVENVLHVLPDTLELIAPLVPPKTVYSMAVVFLL